MRPPVTTKELIARAAEALQESFTFMGHPGTRLPGTECVDCEEAARIVLEAAAKTFIEEERLGEVG